MSLQLKEVIFEGFKNSNFIAKVIFSPKKVSIIHANNGVGKTSLLKGLHSFLEQDESYLLSLNVKRIFCTYTLNNTEYSFDVKLKENKNSFNWKDFEKSELKKSKSLSIAIERGISSSSFSHIDVSDIEKFFDTKHTNSNQLTHLQKPMKRQMAMDIYNFLSSLNRKKSRTLSGLDQDFSQNHIYLENFETANLTNFIQEEYKKAYYNEIKNINRLILKAVSFAIQMTSGNNETNEYPNKVLSSELMLNKDNLISMLSNSHGELSTRTSLLEALKLVDTEEDAKSLLENSIIEHLLRVIITDIKNTNLLSSRFELFKDRFNSYLIKNKKLIVSENEINIKVNNGVHSLDELSSGERHLLTLLFCTLFKCEDRDFLFIDEPEMSLNTTWQTKLLPLLHDLAPNTQIIVASHSPYIVNNRLDYLSELIVE